MSTLQAPAAPRPVAAGAVASSRRRASSAPYHRTMLLGAAAIICVAALLQPRGTQRLDAPLLGQLPTLCLWRQWFGIDCPGCGLTRSFVALMHDDWRSAWHANPAGLPLLAAVLYQIPFHAWQLWRIRCGRASLRHPPLVVGLLCWLAVAALLGQWAWRTL